MPLSMLQPVLGAIGASSRQRRAVRTDAILPLPERAPAARALDRSAVLNIVMVLWKLDVGCDRFHSDEYRRRERREGGMGVVVVRSEELCFLATKLAAAKTARLIDT